MVLVRSLTPTISKFGRSQQMRNTLRPMRPKPLIPTLIFSIWLLLFSDNACFQLQDVAKIQFSWLLLIAISHFFRIFVFMFQIIRLLYWLLEVIEASWERKYEKAAAYIEKNGRTNLRKAIRRRARLRRNRKFLQILFNLILALIVATSGFLIYYIHSLVNTPYDRLVGNQVNAPWWVYLVDLYFIIVAVKALASMNFKRLGNISTFVVSDVVDKGFPYALYLRAFQADQKRDIFKEEELVLTLLHNNIVTFTVGMPEEVDASPGAARIYIANDTWQQDVKRLMEQASILFLRICDTEPCLWELQQALALPNLLCIIVDDEVEYASVFSKCPYIPKNVKPAEGQCEIYLRKENGEWELINLLPRQKEAGQKRTQRREQSSVGRNNALMKKEFTKSLLERFSMPKDGSAREYEKCIEGIFSNMMNDLDQDDTILVATRLLDLMEAYYALGKCKQTILDNIQGYLSQLETFKHLTDELQQRKEAMSAKVYEAKNKD